MEVLHSSGVESEQGKGEFGSWAGTIYIPSLLGVVQTQRAKFKPWANSFQGAEFSSLFVQSWMWGLRWCFTILIVLLTAARASSQCISCTACQHAALVLHWATERAPHVSALPWAGTNCWALFLAWPDHLKHLKSYTPLIFGPTLHPLEFPSFPCPVMSPWRLELVFRDIFTLIQIAVAACVWAGLCICFLCCKMGITDFCALKETVR